MTWTYFLEKMTWTKDAPNSFAGPPEAAKGPKKGAKEMKD